MIYLNLQSTNHLHGKVSSKAPQPKLGLSNMCLFKEARGLFFRSISVLLCALPGVMANAETIRLIEKNELALPRNHEVFQFNEVSLGECNSFRFDPETAVGVISDECFPDQETHINKLGPLGAAGVVIAENDAKFDQYNAWIGKAKIQHAVSESKAEIQFTADQSKTIQNAIENGQAFNIGIYANNKYWAGGLYNYLSFTRAKKSYENKRYAQAFNDAQQLAIIGDARAQLLLGKMYADGRGTIQVTINAHMWFNIASMSGSDGAYEERKNITAVMTPSAVEEAQKMALTCIQSAYADCGLSINTATRKAAKDQTITTIVALKSHFNDQPLMKRKQLQYALKKLGVYSSTVDGLWGSGTSTAFTNYIKINDLSASPSEAVFGSVLSKVDVPTAFAIPKKRVVKNKPSKTNLNTNTAGLRPIIDNPSISGAQAKAICEPQAKMASRNTGASSSGSTRTRCTGYGYSINCTSSDGPSSAAEGFLLGLASGLEKRSAREDAMASCLAQYGWRK